MKHVVLSLLLTSCTHVDRMQNPVVDSVYITRMHAEDMCTIGWLSENRLPPSCRVEKE